MADLETLLQLKSENLHLLNPLTSGKKRKRSGLTVLGVYAEQKVLDKLSELCTDNRHSFCPFKNIRDARHLLNTKPKDFGVIALDISLAEQDEYRFIQHLKAEFRGDDVYVTYVNSNDAKMKASLENARKHIGGKVSIVPWKHSSGTVDPAEGASTSTVLPKTQSVPSSGKIQFSILEKSQYNDPAEGASVSTEPPKIKAGPSSSETVDLSVLKNSEYNDPEGASVSTEPPKIQAGPSSSEIVVDLSVLKNPEYNDPEGASVSTELQMGLPEDSNNSAKRRRTQ